MIYSKKRTIGLFLTALILALASTWAVWRAEADIAFQPKRTSIVVLPSEIASVGWNNIESIRMQDLGEHALYQMFDAQNSAYLKAAESTPTQVEGLPIHTPDAQIGPEGTVLDEETDEFSQIENQEEIGDTATEEDVAGGVDQSSENPETDTGEISVDIPLELGEAEVSDPSPPSDEDTRSESVDPQVEDENTAALWQPLDSVAGFFKRVSRSLTLANLSEEEGVEVSADTHDSGDTTPANDDSVISDTEDLSAYVDTDPDSDAPEMSVTEDVEDHSTQEGELGEVLEISTSTTEDEGSGVVESIDADLDVFLTDEDIESGADESASRDAEREDTRQRTRHSSASTNSITLSDFGLPPLESGQFVEGMQLRLSLGARHVREGGPPSKIDVSYAFGELERRAGSVLLEQEASNALNGGYFVIAMPSITNVDILRDFSVTISFDGDVEALDGVYIDAAVGRAFTHYV
jgi:hypothetical protein